MAPNPSTPAPPKRKRRPGMPVSEILDLYSTRAPDGCLIWDRSVDSGGYGQVSYGGRPVRVHRLAWENIHGPIPKGLVLDHECHNAAADRGECAGGPCPHRRCLELDHLALKTTTGNFQASPLTTTSINAAKTHCINGHQFTSENTYIRPDNQARVCRQCANDRKHIYYRAASTELPLLELGRELRAARKSKGMSVLEVASRADVSRGLLVKLERGMPVSAASIAAVAEVLNSHE